MGLCLPLYPLQRRTWGVDYPPYRKILGNATREAKRPTVMRAKIKNFCPFMETLKTTLT